MESLLTVHRYLETNFVVRNGRIIIRDKGSGRATQPIVFSAKDVATTVPRPNWFACHIIQYPTFAGLHTELVNLITQHVVAISHHYTIFRVDDLALVAFDIHLDTRREFHMLVRLSRVWTIVGERHEGSAQRIEVSDCRSVRMSDDFQRSLMFGISRGKVNALGVPCLPGGGLCFEVLRNVFGNIRISARVSSLISGRDGGVVHVIG